VKGHPNGLLSEENVKILASDYKLKSGELRRRALRSGRRSRAGQRVVRGQLNHAPRQPLRPFPNTYSYPGESERSPAMRHRICEALCRRAKENELTPWMQLRLEIYLGDWDDYVSRHGWTW
jgi:hypothetical protein